MGIRAYQPHRKDLLINTECGIAKEQQLFFIFFSLLILVFSIPMALKESIWRAAFVISFLAIFLTIGLGLLRYKNWARITASIIFAFFLFIPFFSQDDKGAPFFWFVGILGLYYLYRKTA